MENSLIYRFARFVKYAYTKKIKEVLAGLSMVLFGGGTLFFNHIPPELRNTWIGVWVWIKTIFTAFSSSLATAYGSYLIDKIKEKKSPRNPRLNGKRNAA